LITFAVFELLDKIGSVSDHFIAKDGSTALSMRFPALFPGKVRSFGDVFDRDWRHVNRGFQIGRSIPYNHLCKWPRNAISVLDLGTDFIDTKILSVLESAVSFWTFTR
jgi:hypothetical protein